MKISVVILNWNRPDDTILAIESTLRQRDAAFEILVWDNASMDASRSTLESRFGREPRVKFAFGDANYGVAGGRNRAFPLTDGELILSLDSDAVFESDDALARVAACFQENPDLGAASFEVKRPDGHLMWPFSRPASGWRKKSFETIRVDGCAFAVRRGVFTKTGGFPEHFSPYGAEDAHFALKVIGAGCRILYLPSVVVVHAFSTAGRNRTQFTMHVRNSLLIPLELFPVPQACLSAAKLALSLLRDALEQRRVGSFFAGAWKAIAGFRLSNRTPMPRSRWRHLRQLIATDKRLAASP